jgi:pyridoxamine 5'-phosphate oxidase
MFFMERFSDLDGFSHAVWHLLFKASSLRKGGLQLGTIGTIDEKGRPDQRIVVVRDVKMQERKLIFFTDFRSQKVQQFKKTSIAGWLFWDPRKKLQIRLHGDIHFHHKDDVAKQYWRKLPVAGRKNYTTILPPSTSLAEDGENLPEGWSNTMPIEQTERYFQNFLVCTSTITEMTCLHLHKEGHQHTRFSWQGEKWEGTWIVP